MADTLIQLSEPKVQTVFSVENASVDMVDMTRYNDIFDVVLLMDPETDTYERVVFSFFDFFGLIGGVFEILTIICGIIVGFVSKQTFFYSIFKRLYHSEEKLKMKDIFEFKKKIIDDNHFKRTEKVLDSMESPPKVTRAPHEESKYFGKIISTL